MIKDYCGSLYGDYRQVKFTDIYDNVEDFLADYKDVGIPTSISDKSATTLFYLLYSRYGNSTIAASDTTRFKYRLFGTIFESGPTWEKRLDLQEKLRNLTQDQLISGEGYKSQTDRTINTTTSQTASGKEDSTGSGTSEVTGTDSSSGTKIKNYAENPGTSPATSADTPLTYINRQDYEKDSQSGSTTSNGTTSTTNSQTSSSTNSGSKDETGKDVLSSTRTRGLLESYGLLNSLLVSDVTSEFLNKFRKLFLTIVLPEQPLYYITEDSEDE